MDGKTTTINKSHIRSYIMRIQEVVRPGWKFERVSDDVYEELNQLVMKKIRDSLKCHPSVGKTFKYIQ